MYTYKRRRRALALVIAALALLVFSGCGRSAAGTDAQAAAVPATAEDGDIVLTIGAYSVVKDAMADILPAFKAHWEAQTGQRIEFRQSYEASGTQARSIVGGFEADVALLAMEGDMDKIAAAGLIQGEWRTGDHSGMITRSIVVIGTRPGNPLGVRDFADLTRPGIKVLYPNPQTSGGAQWVINAIYGAGLAQAVDGVDQASPPDAAKRFLSDVHRNIESMDKSGRASMAAFEYGVGDVIVTYENELLARIASGVDYEIIVPKHTIRIDNPAAVIDYNADRHGVRAAAEQFLSYLRGEEAQRIFVRHGFRPVSDSGFDSDWRAPFVDPQHLFTIDDLGGWDHVRQTLYTKHGVWYQVLSGR